MSIVLIRGCVVVMCHGQACRVWGPGSPELRLGCEEGGKEDGGDGEGDEGAGMDEGAGTSVSGVVGSIEVCTMTGDKDRTRFCACEVRTTVSSDVTFDFKAEIVLCAAAL